MRLEIKTKVEFEALWTALQQYVDNNDPEECGADNSDPAVFEAAQRLLAKCDAEAVKAGEAVL